jgi:hypothetical protein
VQEPPASASITDRSPTTASTNENVARAAGAEQESSTPSPPPKSSPRMFHRPIMQSMPDNRQQSFDEIYGPPENFLEIEVRLPLVYSPLSPCPFPSPLSRFFEVPL